MLPCRFPHTAERFALLTRLAMGKKSMTHSTAPVLTRA